VISPFLTASNCSNATRPSYTQMAYFLSSSIFKSGICPISFRYIRTGSSTLTEDTIVSILSNSSSLISSTSKLDKENSSGSSGSTSTSKSSSSKNASSFVLSTSSSGSSSNKTSISNVANSFSTSKLSSVPYSKYFSTSDWFNVFFLPAFLTNWSIIFLSIITLYLLS